MCRLIRLNLFVWIVWISKIGKSSSLCDSIIKNNNVGNHLFRLKYNAKVPRKGARSWDHMRSPEWKIKLECNSEAKKYRKSLLNDQWGKCQRDDGRNERKVNGVLLDIFPAHEN